MSGKMDAKGYLMDAYGLEIVGPGDTDGELEVRPVTDQAREEIFGAAAKVPQSAFLGTDVDQTVKIDARGLVTDALSSEGIQDVEIEFSSPENPINTPALGLVDQIKLAKAVKPSERKKVLMDAGAEDVKVNEETGEMLVKQNGLWQKANSDFMAQTIGESPIVAAGIAGAMQGAATGAKVGAVLGPKGAFVGGLVGSTLFGVGAATAARLADVTTAKAAGLRDDTDVEELMDEVGREFVDGLIFDGSVSALIGVLPGAGKGLKAVGKGISKLNFPGKHILKRDFVKALGQDLPQTVELLTGIPRASTATVMEAAQEGTETNLKNMRNMIASKIEWDRTLTNKSPVNPLVRKAGSIAETGIKKARKVMSKEFDEVDKILTRAGVFNKKTTSGDLLNPLNDVLRANEVIDDAGNYMSRAITDPETGDLVASLTPADERMFKKIVKQVNALTGIKGDKPVSVLGGANPQSNAVKLDNIRRLIRNIEQEIRTRGAYNAGDNAISSNAIRIAQNLKHEYDRVLTKALSNQKIKIPGPVANKLRLNEARVAFNAQTFDAGAVRGVMNKKYSDTRTMLDEYARKRFNSDKIGEVFLREGAKDSSEELARFGRMLESVGDAGNNVVRDFRQVSAANNFSELYSGAGSVPLNEYAWISSPTKKIQQFVLTASSPRDTFENAIRLQRRQGLFGRIAGIDDAVKKPLGLNSTGTTALTFMGRLTESMLQATSTQQGMRSLATNPEVYRAMFTNSLTGIRQKEEMEKLLVNEVVGGAIQSNGGQ